MKHQLLSRWLHARRFYRRGAVDARPTSIYLPTGNGRGTQSIERRGQAIEIAPLRSSCRVVHGSEARPLGSSRCSRLRRPHLGRCSFCVYSQNCLPNFTELSLVGSLPRSIRPGFMRIVTTSTTLRSMPSSMVTWYLTYARSTTKKTNDGDEPTVVSSPTSQPSLRQLPNLALRRSTPPRHAIRPTSTSASWQSYAVLELSQAKPGTIGWLRTRHWAN